MAASDKASTQQTETSSAATLSSRDDDPNPGNWGFFVAGDPPRSDDPQGREADADSLRGDDMPGHWRWRRTGSGILGIIRETGSSPGPVSSSEVARTDAKSPAFSSDDDLGDDMSISVVSVETSGSSKLWDQMESKSSRYLMEARKGRLSQMKAGATPRERAIREGQARRRAYVKRCARAVAGIVALGALSASAVYFITVENFDLGAVSGMIPDAAGLRSLFGRFRHNSEEQEGDHSQLTNRALPQSIPRDTASAPPEDGESQNSPDDARIARQQRNQIARAKRIQAREQREARRKQNRDIARSLEGKEREHIY